MLSMRRVRVYSQFVTVAFVSASGSIHAQQPARQPPQEFVQQAAQPSVQQPAQQKAVLVTGASSGLGRATAEKLASEGYFVYAGARQKADIDALSAIRNMQGVRLDVTVPAEIDAAVELVRKAGKPLHGIVNNAGIGLMGALIELEQKDMDFIFNVNVFGMYRITKAFAPMLIENKGRVVNISSLNGVVASPFFGAYSMTKHATESFGDALASEMARFGVRVSLIEPGNYRSEIGISGIARFDTTMLKTSRFEPQMRSMMNSMRQFENAPAPEAVADAVYDALSSANPRPRYLVVPVASQGAVVIRKLLDVLAQMNESQKFTIGRDSLVKMLDDAIARVKAR